MVGVTGFEPATSASRRSAKSHSGSCGIPSISAQPDRASARGIPRRYRQSDTGGLRLRARGPCRPSMAHFHGKGKGKNEVDQREGDGRAQIVRIPTQLRTDDDQPQ